MGVIVKRQKQQSWEGQDQQKDQEEEEVMG